MSSNIEQSIGGHIPNSVGNTLGAILPDNLSQGPNTSTYTRQGKMSLSNKIITKNSKPLLSTATPSVDNDCDIKFINIPSKTSFKMKERSSHMSRNGGSAIVTSKDIPFGIKPSSSKLKSANSSSKTPYTLPPSPPVAKPVSSRSDMNAQKVITLAEKRPSSKTKTPFRPRSGTDRPNSSSLRNESSTGTQSKPSSAKQPPSARQRQSSAGKKHNDNKSLEKEDESVEPETPRRTFKTINLEEILSNSQEKNCEKVYEINLHACDLTAINNLEKFKHVRVLDLSCNFIDKIQNMECNEELRELKLYDNRIRTIERLSHFKELCSLQVQHNKIKNINKGLSSLGKLRYLRLDCNRLLKVDPAEISCCPNLVTIDISYNMIDNLSALNYLPKIEEIFASNNRLRNVELSRCKLLQEVDFSCNRITDVSGLRNLPNLQIVNLTKNCLTSVKPLGKSKSIEELHLAENRLTELSYFPTQFQKLEILDVACNKIEDSDELCCMQDLEYLAELFISGNPFGAPDGPHAHYMSDVQALLPSLEILDGAHVKRHTQKGAPLMRPMSASSILSVRQVEAQMKSSDDEMKSIERSFLEKFDSLRELMDTLPDKPPSSSLFKVTEDIAPSEAVPSRSSSSRLRMKEALNFAASVTDET